MAKVEQEEEKKEENKKISSRKFIVWLVWLIVLVVAVVFVFVSVIITKQNNDNFNDIIKTVINDFFYVSLLYLGANVGQKAIYKFSEKKEDKE